MHTLLQALQEFLRSEISPAETSQRRKAILVNSNNRKIALYKLSSLRVEVCNKEQFGNSPESQTWGSRVQAVLQEHLNRYEKTRASGSQR